MAAVPLPDMRDAAPAGSSPVPTTLYSRLLDTYKIEIPVCCWPAPPKRHVRISAQLYNTLEQYKTLAAAVKEILSSPGAPP